MRKGINDALNIFFVAIIWLVFLSPQSPFFFTCRLTGMLSAGGGVRGEWFIGLLVSGG